jgi:hypothetical protein
MRMASNIRSIVASVALAASPIIAPFATAQYTSAPDPRFDPANSIKFDLRPDAPLAVASFDPAESIVSSRGGALVIDLHVLAKLRNTSSDYIRGVTLLLLAQESTPGGKLSVAAPSINVAPGESFPIRIDGRLMRPVQAGLGPLVRVTLDGVLFKNYEFYGPDRLNSRRQMLAWELQAERDRKYYKQVLQTQGVAGLQKEMLDSLDRQAKRPTLDVQLARGRSTSSAATMPDHVEHFAFLQIPDSPVRPQDGWAEIAKNEARAPQISVQNNSSKSVRYVEIAWLIKDTQGREYLAGSVPASEGELYLPPGRSARLAQETSLRFSRNGGQPVDIQSMMGFVSQVEFSDGNVWIPRNETLRSPALRQVMPPSYEERRLADLYRTKGPDALVRELNRF